MTTPEAITRSETRESGRLWFGLLTAPLAWAAQLGVDWFLAEVVACSPNAKPPGDIGSVPIYTVTASLNALLLALAGAAGWVAWRSLRELRRHGDDTAGRRAEWMARGGVINSVVFMVMIAASYVSIASTGGCMP
jgi:hypothetical protein